MHQYALLVKNDDTPPEDPNQQFHEYSNWVKHLKQLGWAGGEALHGDAYRLNGRQNPEVEIHPLDKNDISGYFLFEAASLEEALDIAKTCPHLQYSGTLELRDIFH
ncbi:MAG TPA: YciI family protein [Flavilitoribacter sp.]|nr:YciI family protein [Flavilitoribacter sp.]HMQ88876.1 YciI family protein [Flavilitoribacter sp.]